MEATVGLDLLGGGSLMAEVAEFESGWFCNEYLCMVANSASCAVCLQHEVMRRHGRGLVEVSSLETRLLLWKRRQWTFGRRSRTRWIFGTVGRHLESGSSAAISEYSSSCECCVTKYGSYYDLYLVSCTFRAPCGIMDGPVERAGG